MARFEKHCEDCRKKLGKPYEKVHHWLDDFAITFPVNKWGDYHRQFRHNQNGIDEIRKMWGNEAAKAARLHIIEDMGYIPVKAKPIKIDWND
jgi:hypothetical protein